MLYSKSFLLLAKLKTYSYDSPPAVSDRRNTLCAGDSYNWQRIGLNHKEASLYTTYCKSRKHSWRREMKAQFIVLGMPGPAVHLLWLVFLGK